MKPDNGIRNRGDVAARFRKLIEASQYLAEIESLDALIPKLLELAKEVTSAEASSLMHYIPDRDVLEFAYVKDEIIGDTGGQTLKNTIELKVGQGIAGWVAQHRKPLIIKDVQNDPRFSTQADKLTGFITRTLLSVPLIYGKELLGVINVLNSKDKPCFDVEDQELLESFACLAAVAVIRYRLLKNRLKQQKLEVQLSAAAKIQSLFWPRHPEAINGSCFWAVSIPAAFVGGDLYDFIPMSDGSWIIYVADVSDKGLPAALIMVALWSKLREKASLHPEADKLLTSVNHAMYDLMSREGFFATIILARYWPATGKMRIVRGGHLNPLWIDQCGLRSIPELRGATLGVASEAAYEKVEIILSPGESILFISDGVTEAENEKAEFYGNVRLEAHIKNSSGPPWGKGLLNSVKAWQGAAPASDDLTLLEIWRKPE